MIVIAPFVIAFLIFCWYLAHHITWLGVIFLFTGIHWILTSKGDDFVRFLITISENARTYEANTAVGETKHSGRTC